jgi:hypothetical protein
MAHVRSFVGTRNCATCGNQFRLRADAAKAGRGLYCSIKCSNEGRFAPLTADIVVLKTMYCEQDMTLKEIAKHFGVDWKRVQRRLAAAGVSFRSGRRRNPNRRSMVRYRRMVRAKPGEVVHHLNCLETDDRLENLVAVSRHRHFATAQAIGANLSQAIYGGIGDVRSDERLSDDRTPEENVVSVSLVATELFRTLLSQQLRQLGDIRRDAPPGSGAGAAWLNRIK